MNKTTQATIALTENGFRVCGPISFYNVVSIRMQGEQLLSELKSAVVDLSEMIDQDASSLSLILCWERFARKKQCLLTVTRLSSSLLRMGKMFGLK